MSLKTTERQEMKKKEKVLITGGAGFIGSHLAEELLMRNYKVVVLDNFSTGKEENVAHLFKNPDFELVVGNILDEKLVRDLVKKVDLVFHLAAAVGVKLIIEKPLESLTTNVKGSEIVFGACQVYRKKVLFTSSSEVYGKNAYAPLNEDDDIVIGSPLKSRWSYSMAKAVGEILAFNYCREKEMPAVVVRLFNVIGPRQSGDYGMVVPRFIGNALKNKPLTVYGDGRQTRCFLYIEDAVRALIELIDHPGAEGEVFNLGSDEEITIKELAELIVCLTNSSSEIDYLPYEQVYEGKYEDMRRRVPNLAKVRKLIDFKPAYSLEKSLKVLIEVNKEKYYGKKI